MICAPPVARARASRQYSVVTIDCVEAVSSDKVTVLRRGRRQQMAFGNESELARILTSLRDEGLPFVQHSHGWEPGDVFADLRERGLVTGTYDAISWSRPGEAVTQEGR
jgi:hypothetical protein